MIVHDKDLALKPFVESERFGMKLIFFKHPTNVLFCALASRPTYRQKRHIEQPSGIVCHAGSAESDYYHLRVLFCCLVG